MATFGNRRKTKTNFKRQHASYTNHDATTDYLRLAYDFGISIGGDIILPYFLQKRSIFKIYRGLYIYIYIYIYIYYTCLSALMIIEPCDQAIGAILHRTPRVDFSSPITCCPLPSRSLSRWNGGSRCAPFSGMFIAARNPRATTLTASKASASSSCAQHTTDGDRASRRLPLNTSYVH